MWACHATSRGRAKPSAPPFGRRRFKAGAQYADSTSTATGKGTWPGTAASTGPSSSIRSIPIAIGRTNSVETTLPMGSSARISPSRACRTQEVCIGDRYRIGGALFEVTQPRVTCYRVGIRMNEPQMAALLVAHGRPGFYLRVLEEGEVEAGDEIVQVASGPERMTVFEINALLYMPGHPRSQLERALRIPALSAGWRASFEALLDAGAQRRRDDGKRRARSGVRPAPGVAGFRPFRVSRQDARERQRDLAGARAHGWAPSGRALPGQFIVLRLEPAPDAPALMRSYSLSGEPSAERYRVSVKREPHGAASAYIDDELQVGDIVEQARARGSFTLRPGDAPVVLLSAGIGATPVLAMLHALAAEASPREIWWLYGARNGREHPFAEETRVLLKALPTATATSATARPIPRIGQVVISTLPDAWTCERFRS